MVSHRACSLSFTNSLPSWLQSILLDSTKQELALKMFIKIRCLGLKPLNQVLLYLIWSIDCGLSSPHCFSKNAISTAQCDYQIAHPCLCLNFQVRHSRWLHPIRFCFGSVQRVELLPGVSTLSTKVRGFPVHWIVCQGEGAPHAVHLSTKVRGFIVHWIVCRGEVAPWASNTEGKKINKFHFCDI